MTDPAPNADLLSFKDRTASPIANSVEGSSSNSALRSLLRCCLLLLLTRILLSSTSILLGLNDYPLLPPLNDIFADSIKSGLAQTSISHRLLADDAVREWFPLFRRYLFDNDYLKAGWSIHHSPPLSMLVLMGVAAMLLVLTPLGVVASLVALYAAGAAAVATCVRAAASSPIRGPVLALILFAFPSLFMLDRGNIHSGVTSLCVIFYAVGACLGIWKWSGCAALALAVNLRPNVALFALLEFARTDRPLDAAVRIAVVGALSLGLGVIAFGIVHGIDPTYTPASFLAGLDLYTRNYVVGLSGLHWNSSLTNLERSIRHELGLTPSSHVGWTVFASVLGLAMVTAFATLAWLRNLPAAWLSFALAACCSLFTPVLGQYHLLIFVAPLLVLVIATPTAITANVLSRATACLIVLQLLCFLQAIAPHPVLLLLLALTASSFPFLVLRAAPGATAAPAVLALASMAALAPLGGEVTQNIAICLMLLATLSWLLWRCAAPPRLIGATTVP